MEKILVFPRKSRRNWHRHEREIRFSSTSRRRTGWSRLRITILAGCLAGLAYTQVDMPAGIWRWPIVSSDTPKTVVTDDGTRPDRLIRDRAGANVRFGLCHSGGGQNCVVDGDTFWVDGAKIRIADIDTPETHPPRCAAEAELGERATRRLQVLLNQGAFDLEILGRDTDRYGRKLRIVTRDGTSIGGMLVSEGLARPYGRGRQPWCD